MQSRYIINKGVNKPIEFKGIKAQYIAYLAVGLLVLLLLFALLFTVGTPAAVCVVFVVAAGSALFIIIIRYSNKYGEDGLMKEASRRKIPHCIRSRKRRPLFTKPNQYHSSWN